MGFLYTFTVLVLLVVAGINNSIALFAYTMLLVILGIMTMLLTNSNLSQVAIEYPAEWMGCEGQVLHLPILLRSKVGGECVNLKLECLANDSLLGLAEQVSVYKNRETTCHVAIPLNKCGILQINTLRVSSSYPLGLLKTWTLIDSNITIYAHPKPLGNNLKAQLNSQFDSSKEQKKIEKGAEPDDYYGLRAFRFGDSIRHIDWKAAARSRELLIKEWSSQEAPNYEFNLDMIRTKNLLMKLRQIALWIMQAEQQGASYNLRLEHAQKPLTSLNRSLKALTQYGHKHL